VPPALITGFVDAVLPIVFVKPASPLAGDDGHAGCHGVGVRELDRVVAVVGEGVGAERLVDHVDVVRARTAQGSYWPG